MRRTNRASSAGTKPMRPTMAIRKVRRASEGRVCNSPVTAITGAARRGRRCAAMPSGTATVTASASEPSTRARCWPSSLKRSGASSLAMKPCAGAPDVAPGSRCRNSRATSANGRPPSSAGGVELDHARLGQLAGQSLQRPVVDFRAHQQHGVVAGEEVAVIAQHAHRLSGELGIGRVDVDQIHLGQPPAPGRPGHGRARCRVFSVRP